MLYLKNLYKYNYMISYIDNNKDDIIENNKALNKIKNNIINIRLKHDIIIKQFYDKQPISQKQLNYIKKNI